jgi:hypothetical protein
MPEEMQAKEKDDSWDSVGHAIRREAMPIPKNEKRRASRRGDGKTCLEFPDFS